MTQQIINTGTGPNAQDGDSLYVAFTKVNDNFNSIWAQGPVDSNLVLTNNSVISTDVNGNIVLTPNGIGYVRLDNTTIPGANNAYFLGDSTRRWRGIYAGSGGINTTGNLYAGNLIISGNTEFSGDVNFTGNLTTSENFSAAGNIAGGGSLSIPGNITAGPGLFYGDVGITGNLQVTGNIIYIDVEELRIEDPILEIGGGPNGAPLVAADGFSRGLQLDYFNVAANTQQIAFTGLAAPDYTTYQFLTNATNTANTYTGTPANLYFGNANVAGEISVAGNITSGGTFIANTYAANVVEANVSSIAGNIYSGNIINDGTITSVGMISSTSNVAGAYFIGNGSFLTGVVTSVSNISNGTSRVDIPSAGSNVTVDINGTPNVAVFATTGLYVAGLVSTTGNVISNTFAGTTVSVTANITGGNISTTGRIVAGTTLSAVGNITGNYILGNGRFLSGIDTTLISNGTSNVKVETADGNVSINIAGNNIATYNATGEFVTGVISATGTITGSYLYSSGELSAAGNVVGNNLNVTNVVSAGGNVYGGNVITGKVAAAAGNLTLTSPSNIVLQPTGNVVLFDHFINGVADPVQAQDAATKSYVDNAVSAGLNIHQPVYVERPDTDGNLPAVYTDGGIALTITDIVGGTTLTTSTAHGLAINDLIVFDTTTNGLVAGTAYFVYSTPASDELILADGYNGEEITTLTDGTGLTIGSLANSGVGATLSNAGPNAVLVLDGVTMTGGERVLIYTQTNAYENGVYVVTDPGSILTPWILTRASDSDKYIPNSPQGASSGDYYYVQAGDTGAGESYVLNQPATGPIIFGTTNIDFVQFSSVQVYNAGAGLALDNTTFNVLVDPDTLEINGSNEVAIKAGANLVTPNIGDATGSSLSLTGNITAGNANIGSITISNVSVTGNVIGGNILTGGIVSATGDITGANISGSNLLTTGIVSATGNITGANVNAITFYGNVKGGNVSLSANVLAGGVLTDNYYYANGTPVDFQQAAGANTQIQFNNNNDFGASANLTFSTATNTLGVGGNISASGTINSGNITLNNWIQTPGGTNLIVNPGTSQVRIIANTEPYHNDSWYLGASNARWKTIYGNAGDFSGVVSAAGNITGGNLITAGNAVVTGIKTDNYMYANGQPLDMQQPAGSNTQIQFNNNNDFGASANLTFDSSTNNLFVGGNVVSPTISGNLIGTTASLTGNITGGNIETTGHLTSGPADFTGNVVIVGNLIVDGNVTYIDVKDLRVEDPIIDLGGGPNGTPLTTNDGFSRGLKLEYFNTLANAPQAGFMGLAASDYTTYQFLTNATDVGNTFTGTAANLYFGNASVVGNVTTGGILTDNYYYANGQPLDMQQPAGSNTQIQFNNNNDFGASANLTFDNATNILDVGGNITAIGNISGGNLLTLGNAVVTGIKTDNYMYANGQPLDMQQPAGSNTWIQYNDNGNFGATTNFTFDADNQVFYIGGFATITGNIIGGNLYTGGLVSAAGNIIGGNLRTGGFITATGNIDGANLSGEYIIGTMSTSTQPNITSLGTLTGLTVNGTISASGNVTGNVVTGNVISSVGNAYIGGNLYVTGNVTYINITDLNVQDPIISMGRGPNNTPLTVNDGKDRGEQLWYYTSSEKSAFIGWDNSTGNLIAAVDVTNNSEVITVNNWGNFTVGNLLTSALNSANLLFVNTSSNVVTVGDSTVTAGATFAVNATDSILIPVGNTFQRPGTPAVGMVRFNTTLDAFEYYSSVDGWTQSGSGGTTSLTSQTFTADGSTVTYTLSNPSTTVDSLVMINGVTQIPTSSYSIVGTTLTFTEAPEAGDTIEVREIVAQATVHAITNSSGNASVTVDDAGAHVEITGDLIPTANVTYNLGSPTAQWNDLYLSGNTIYIGGNTLSVAAGNLTFNGNIVGDYVYGNGAFLTGIAASYGNANVVANLAALGSNPVSTTGNVTSGNINSAGGIYSDSASGELVIGDRGNASATKTRIVSNTTFTYIQTGNGTGGSTGNVVFSPYSSATQRVVINTSSGNVTASGNVIGGNITTTGLISATGNITGGNILGGANVNATTHTGTTVSVTGNVTSGNVSTGNLSVSGNVTGNIVFTGANVILNNATGAGGSDEGGELHFATATANTTLSGPIAIDIYQNKMRFFETAGNTYGMYIDIANAMGVAGSSTGVPAIGYRDVPQVSFGANATAAASDAGKHYYSTTAGNLALTLPDNSNVAFSTGATLTIVVNAAGNVLVNAAAGVTLYMAGSSTAGNRVVGAYGLASVMKVAANTWVISGTGVY